MKTSSLLWRGFLFYYLYKINWNLDALTAMVWLIRFISVRMTATLNLAFLWKHEIINSPVHRCISRYPESSVQRNYITFYKYPFTHIMRNWLHGFLMSSFSQRAASGLRKHCKTDYIQCTQYFMIPHIQNLVQNKNIFTILHPCLESTEKEHRISLVFSKKH